jgi:hypothetical protein
LDDERVLVAGGAWADLGGENSAEILQIRESRVRFGGQKMSTLRSSATHNRLKDGRILFIGGATDFEPAISSTDIFDPKTNSFSPGPNMLLERSGHASVTLADGRVLVFGGTDGYRIHDSVEIYNPVSGTFSLASSKMLTPRANHTATLVNESTVAIIGGETIFPDSQQNNAASFLRSIELFDVASMQFVEIESKMSHPRIYHTAIRLDEQRVMVAGGLSDLAQSSDSLEILNVSNHSVAVAGHTLRGRSLHSLTLLNDGTFLIAGGVENGIPLSDSERCRFVGVDDINCLSGAQMSRTRWGHTATSLPNGKVLFIGGLTNTPEFPKSNAGPIRGLELFLP